MNDIWILNATAIPEIQWRRNGSFKFDITSTLSADESEFTTSLEDFDFDPASERANISSGRDVLPRSLFGASLLQGNKILIFGGIGPVGSEITSNITVLDTQDWSWKPFFWEPRDGLSNRYVSLPCLILQRYCPCDIYCLYDDCHWHGLSGWICCCGGNNVLERCPETPSPSRSFLLFQQTAHKDR